MRLSLKWMSIRLGFVLLVFVTSVAAFEGVLRLGLIPNPKYGFESMDRRWKGSSHRLLILGDSFIEPGAGLARALNAEFSERDIAVRNLAIAGTGPFEYLERLRMFLQTSMKFPDVVLLSYYAGNDLTDVQHNPKFNPKQEGVAIRTVLPAIRQLPSQSWSEWFYLTHYARKQLADPMPVQLPALNWAGFIRAGYDSAIVADAKNSEINPWLLTLSNSNPNHLLDNVMMETPENEAAWKRTKKLLNEIKAICSQRGAKLLFVMFPRSIQIDESHFPFFKRLRFNIDKRTLLSTRPQDLMSELCESLEVPLLDLLPILKRSQDRNLFREKDDHLNTDGNSLATAEIVPWLLAQID